MNISAERREVTNTKLFITINGEEFEAKRVIDFLRSLMGTDGFVTGLTGVSGRDRELAETLEECGAAAHTHSAGWCEDDEETANELFTEVMVLYYDNLERNEVNAEQYR